MIRLFSRLAVVTTLALGLFGRAAAATSVYPGCATPPGAPSGNAPSGSGPSGSAPSGNVHYVDPVHGSNSGDGTLAHPWHTLTEVVAAGLFYNRPVHGSPHINPNAPIQAGDTVYLLSGNHGPVTLQGWYGKGLVGYNNPSFITIAALPGQTPVLNQLSIIGASKWVFRGLTIQSTNNTGTYPSGGSHVRDYWLISLSGPHSDIVFDGNTLSSSASASQWGLLDWLTKRASGAIEVGGACVAFTNNAFSYVGVGLATQSSNNILIAGNTINYFSDDGIDYGSNNMQIVGNTITNSVEDGDGIHRDAMQGQPYSENVLNSNITIQNNTVIRITDPKLASPGYLQGIDAFDGRWSNVNVSNNVIITDAGHGISYYGVNQAVISNNILLIDSGKVRMCGNLTFSQCRAQSVVYNTANIPFIYVTKSKAGTASANVAVTANITTALKFDISTLSPNIANNTCLLTAGRCVIAIPVNGKMLVAATPGVYGNNNIISTLTPAQAFVLYDPVGMHYNLTLR